MNRELPLGTIVILKESQAKLMIAGLYGRIGDKIKKYIGVQYPQGSLVEELLLYFDEEDISKIISLGNINYKNE